MKAIMFLLAAIVLITAGCRSTPGNVTTPADDTNATMHTNPYPPSPNLMGGPPPLNK